MNIAFYKTPATIDFLPVCSLNKIAFSKGYAYCIILGWLQWTLDIQWTSKLI